jgi:hypothetical protein
MIQPAAFYPYCEAAGHPVTAHENGLPCKTCVAIAKETGVPTPVVSPGAIVPTEPAPSHDKPALYPDPMLQHPTADPDPIQHPSAPVTRTRTGSPPPFHK